MSAIASNLQDVNRRIVRAVEAAQRGFGEVKLIAVTKTFPASAVVDAIEAGQLAFGESYAQEAIEKIALVDTVREANVLQRLIDTGIESGPVGFEHDALLQPYTLPHVEWHFIGPIQSNKTRLIAEHFEWVHGVDRIRIAERLSEQRPEKRPPLNVLVQVNVSGEASKSGVAPDELADLVRAIAALPRLHFRGLMAVPEPADTLQAQKKPFAALRTLAEGLRADGFACTELSMGMSADLEAAILEGASMVRVGTAIFGPRQTTRHTE